MKKAIKAIQREISIRDAALEFAVLKCTLHLNSSQPSRIDLKKVQLLF